MSAVPKYLSAYSEEWAKSPRAANQHWFADARFGLFIHYGLYSQLGRHEWVQLRDLIPIAEYEKLAASFDPRDFDADRITDLALEAGMRYVNLVTCHHEGFCLWNSPGEPFNSYNACGRDLMSELAQQCDVKGLGFFAYFTYALNWRHPFALTREHLSYARPDYPEAQPEYKLTQIEEWKEHWKWVHARIEEICRLEYPLAGFWLDIISAYYYFPDYVPVQETYELIRRLRPEALIAYKQGATGDEDFAAPEFHFASLSERLTKEGKPEAARIAEAAWQINQHKHNEICMSLQEGSWGYSSHAKHKSSEEIWRNLAYAGANRCNLLANIGPLPDGSIHPEEVKVLQEVGKRIREEGWPSSAEAQVPTAGTLAQGV